MLSRVFLAIAFALAATVSCGGKALDGTCSPDGNGGWSCKPLADASGAPLDLAQCPTNFNPSGSCPSGVSGGWTSGGVYSSGDDCLACDSNGQGTHWTCPPPQTWQAAGTYTCSR